MITCNHEHYRPTLPQIACKSQVVAIIKQQQQHLSQKLIKISQHLDFIGFVGLLFINNYNTQQQSVENGLLRKTNHHHHQSGSSSSNGEEVQLDFAVVGFEKTGTCLRLTSTCCTIFYYYRHLSSLTNDTISCKQSNSLSLCVRHDISLGSAREPSRNYHASKTFRRFYKYML